VLISGRGSNLLALIDAIGSATLHAELVAVISNRPEAAGLQKARSAGIETRVVDHRQYPSRATFDTALRERIDAFSPDFVLLAGFMRVLGPDFVDHYHGRLLNIHPSLLPAYRGLDTHARVLAAGEREHGASVHFVTAELDGGPVIARARVAVRADDDPERLAARVLEQEHRLYPTVVGLCCDGRLVLRDHRVLFDGRILDTPIDIDDIEATEQYP
jgi:phosphoribosylglycinamide formyltransferase-1